MCSWAGCGRVRFQYKGHGDEQPFDMTGDDLVKISRNLIDLFNNGIIDAYEQKLQAGEIIETHKRSVIHEKIMAYAGSTAFLLLERIKEYHTKPNIADHDKILNTYGKSKNCPNELRKWNNSDLIKILIIVWEKLKKHEVKKCMQCKYANITPAIYIRDVVANATEADIEDPLFLYAATFNVALLADMAGNLCDDVRIKLASVESNITENIALQIMPERENHAVKTTSMA
ncbi:hypothetical protein BC938DRAFT_482358 [Jimgerdemannia flammicorona]|uniref:Uncharacterized protein n=1 Tax=Jimgerdemannia flammicorona TaxID=994334 RepID=A0A433QWM6_9FUNG|nr:hypothetical protein BC938DRAFT_482358 [Jimgerdemannia flammicorona]